MLISDIVATLAVIEERRKHPTEKQDLLNIMLNGVDQKTGQRLSDQSIRQNVSASGCTSYLPLTNRLCSFSRSLSLVRSNIVTVVCSNPHWL